MRANGYSTPVPRRENELKALKPSEVVEYRLSEEELAKYRALPVPDKKIVGKKPIEIKSKTDLREENRMAKVAKTGPSCGLTKEIFISEIAKGETVSSIERAWNMKNQTLFYWVKRWDLQGINQAKAQELLNGSKGPALKDSNDQQNLAIKTEVYQQTTEMLEKEKRELENEIEFLRQAKSDIQAESDRLLQERDDYKRAAEDLEAKALDYDRLSKDHLQIKEQMSELEKKHADFDGTDRRDPNSAYEALVDLGVLQEHSDPVNHPHHYTRGGIECIDAIEAATSGLSGREAYSTGAALKYLWRWKHKNGTEDLQKASWYINRLIGGDQVEQAK